MKKYILILIISLSLFGISSCSLKERKGQYKVDEFLKELENRYPNHLCWDDGWYKIKFYKKNNLYEESSLEDKKNEIVIDVNCNLEFSNMSSANYPLVKVTKFHATKQKNSYFGTRTSEEFYDGNNMYMKHDIYWFEHNQPEYNEFYVLEKNPKILDDFAIGPFSNCRRNFIYNRSTYTYSYLEYDDVNKCFVYTEVLQEVEQLSKYTFYFDNDLNLLKYTCWVDIRTNDQEDSIIKENFTFSIVPSEFENIIIPEPNGYNTTSKVHEYTFQDIFCNIQMLGRSDYDV